MNEAEALNYLREKIEQAPPAILADVMREHPEWFNVVFERKRELELIEKARTDTLEGDVAFYELIHGFAPPQHVIREVEIVRRAHENGVSSLIWAYRGSWKTVSITQTMTAHQIGLHPRDPNLIVSANDDTAEKITQSIANIIEFHPSWKKIFPNVIPDKGRWSVNGFYVIATDSREQWAKEQAAIIDPTFVGGGWESSRLIGKHPKRLIIDDVHDPKNSSSAVQIRAIVNSVTKGLLKTVLKKDDKMITEVDFIGTPWSVDDMYHHMKNSGQVEFISIPVMTRALENEDGAVYCDGKNKNGIIFDDIVGWWKFTDPKNYGLQSLIKDRAESKVAFWEQMMLDLATAKSMGLKYYLYPHDKIEDTWPMRGGVDPAATFKDRFEEARRNSHFALAYLAKLPTGGAVLTGGVSEVCSPNTAVMRIAAAEALFSNWSFTAFENVGFGIAFRKIVQLINPNLKLVPSDLGGIRQKGEKAGQMRSKHDRIALELAPWFENATIRISDEDTPFLNAFRRLFDDFYDMDDRLPDEAWDVGDAVYHAVKSMPEILQTIPQDMESEPAYVTETRHPLYGLRNRGYG